MKYKLLLLLILFSQCKNTSDEKKDESDTSTIKQETEIVNTQLKLDGCYRKITGRDTMLVSFKETNGEVSGKIRFDNYEKDSSHGTVNGTIKNGVAVLWYDFFSEGMKSHVQYVFKPVENGLLWGISELDYRNDSAHLKDIESIEYPTENFLEKLDCDLIQKQLSDN